MRMATWCVLSGMFHRLRCRQNVPETLLKGCIRARISQIGIVGEIGGGGCGVKHLQACLFHVSARDMGKRLPSGVPQKRKPLPTVKGIKLDKVGVHNHMTVAQLAAAMNRTTDHVYEVLYYIPQTEEYDHDNAVLDTQTIIDVVKKSGMLPQFVRRKVEKKHKHQDVVRQPPPDPSVLVKRPPVVTIMGHVDHGKTTLLDQLRQSNIVEKEFGGITQHIGAFQVTLKSGESICFLDTPGHAAFSAMRSRGAHLTDIVVLVVAADDGVMQQTVESIQHAEDAGVPIIVAINKIDKHNADVDRTKQMLLEHQIQLEEFGGDVQAVPISALKGINLVELQEAIITQAELMNLKGDPVGLVEGRIVESKVDSKQGRLATAVIQRGTLRKGDILIAGTASVKVKAMFGDRGNPIQEAGPGTPVEILGWKETPSAGDDMLQVKTESELKQALAWRHSQKMEKKQEEDQTTVVEKREEHNRQYKKALIERRQQGLHRAKLVGVRQKEELGDEETCFSLVLKGDVDGSVEAILGGLDTFSSKKCQLEIIHFGVGSVTESDIEMAAAFEGEVYAFNVDVPERIGEMAKERGVVIRKHNIIYRLFEDLRASMSSKLPKIQEEVITGEAKVVQVFQVTMPNKKKGYVAGCRCTLGSMSKKLHVKVMRNDQVIYQGSITSLKRFKDEVDSIKKEEEFGLCVDNPDIAFQLQDIVINYDVKDVDQEIDWNPGF